MLDRFLNFGKLGASRICEYLFWAGTGLSIIPAYFFGRFLYLHNTYLKEISKMQNGERVFTYVAENNLLLGIGGAIFVFVCLIFLWKVICEALYLAIRCMEAYLERHGE